MACISDPLQRVAEKTYAGQGQINRLEREISDHQQQDEKKFFADIDNYLSAAGIKDARELIYQLDSKTEYSCEFSMERITNGVITALRAAARAMDPAIRTPEMKPEDIKAYSTAVNTVSEAARALSSSVTSLSFAGHRLSPGLMVFLYAKSYRIKDEDLFGVDAVTSTVIHYRFMQSIEDLKNESPCGVRVIDADSQVKMQALMSALVDALAEGKIYIDEWQRKDEFYAQLIGDIERRLKGAGFSR